MLSLCILLCLNVLFSKASYQASVAVILKWKEDLEVLLQRSKTRPCLLSVKTLKLGFQHFHGSSYKLPTFKVRKIRKRPYEKGLLNFNTLDIWVQIILCGVDLAGEGGSLLEGVLLPRE